MKKYVRTKDNHVLEVWSENKDDYITIKYGAISRNFVIKEADTIEELCDVIVQKPMARSHELPHVIPARGRHVMVVYKPVFLEELKNNVHETFLANWTDKGLIYVAKLNKEGEWELL